MYIYLEKQQLCFFTSGELENNCWVVEKCACAPKHQLPFWLVLLVQWAFKSYLSRFGFSMYCSITTGKCDGSFQRHGFHQWRCSGACGRLSISKREWSHWKKSQASPGNGWITECPSPPVIIRPYKASSCSIQWKALPGRLAHVNCVTTGAIRVKKPSPPAHVFLLPGPITFRQWWYTLRQCLEWAYRFLATRVTLRNDVMMTWIESRFSTNDSRWFAMNEWLEAIRNEWLETRVRVIFTKSSNLTLTSTVSLHTKKWLFCFSGAWH